MMFFNFVFWNIFFWFAVALVSDQYGLASTIKVGLAFFLFYGLVIYVNLKFLVPQFLAKGQYFVYVILLLMLIFSSIPPSQILLKILLQNDHEIYHLYIEQQPFVEYFINCLFFVILSLLFKFAQDWIEYRQKSEAIQNESLQAELNYLKAQVNPHFLFNTLNSLYALTLQKSVRSPQIVQRLKSIMQYMIHDSNEASVTLKRELDYMDSYIELERIRQGEHTKIQYTVTGDIDQQKIAPLLLVPFLENSFKHGLNQNATNPWVDLHIDVQSQSIQFNLRNNKPLKRTNRITNDSNKGIGLVNVKRRLKLIYPNRHELKIDDSENEFVVNLNIDFK